MSALELTLSPKKSAEVDVNQLDTAKPLEVIFAPFQTTLQKWQEKAASLVVTDINQKTEMAQARLARLELKEARVTMDKTRLGLVAGLKERTARIDSTARIIRQKMEELEDTLLASEQFAERHAAKMKSELKMRRESELMPFMDTPILGDLSDLSEDDWNKTLTNAKAARQAKLDAIAKAESERKAKEEAERIERERVAAENARLKAEAAEATRLAEVERKRVEAERAEERRKAQEEAQRLAQIARKEKAEALAKAEAEAARLAEQAQKEREAIETKARAEAAAAAKEAARLKAEIAAKEKSEAEQRAKAEAERKAIEEAQRAAAAAPDAAKLKAFASTIRQLVIPGLNNATVKNQLHEQTVKFADWVEAQIPKLS